MYIILIAENEALVKYYSQNGFEYVDKDNNAYLIDIEGAKFYDVEEELSFLEMRFNKRLGKEDIVDEQRMYFYYIGHCLGSLHGAVELKQKDYYDIDNVNGMIEFFHKQMAKII